MKSIFTKLSTLLFCGVVAMVGCTDFSEDIQAVDKKVDDLTSSTQTELTNLKGAVAALEAKLDAQYATKEEVAALKSTLEDTIAEEVAALNGDIAKVNAALQTAQEQISAAIADLDDKKADKTAVDAAIKTATEAIEKLNSDLQAVKDELEGKIAAAQATLEEQIAAVDAKAMENYNTLVALSEYLEGLEAKVDEINNTLLSLSEYLPEMKAELEGKIADVDAKAIENYNTLVSLSEHLKEYEATTDMKLVELQGSLAALSAYLEEYEASVDTKFKEILGTFESLSLFLDEKFAALEDTDTDLYAEIDGLREAFTNLNNLLEDEVKARQAADEELYNKISEETQAKVEELQQMFTNLNNLLEDEAAARQEADNEIYAEMENIRTYVGQVYNALSLEIQTVADGLKAHIAAFEAYKATIEEALKELSEEDAAIRGELGSAVLNLTNLIEDLQKEDEAIYAEIDGVREALTQLKNALELQISEAKAEAIAAAKKDALEKFNMLTTVIIAAEDRLNDKIEHAMQLMAALDGRVATLEEQAASMQAAIDELNVAVEALQEMDQAILAEIESLKAEDKAIKAELKAARKELQEQIDALVAAKEALEARVSVLEELVADNADAIADNRKNIEANIDAISEAAKALGRLEGTVNAFMQSSAAADAALSEVDAKLQAAIDAAAAELASAVGRIAAVEDAVKALQELAATLASKEYVDAATADLEHKIKYHYDAIARQLDAYVLQLTIGNAQNAADIASLKSAVAEANAAIAALEGRVDNIEIDIEALEDAVKEIYDALDALKAENAQQASTIQGLKDLCSEYLNMIGANKDENIKQSKQIAEILVAIEDLKNELGDIAEWQTFVNTTLNQLSNQIYEAIGLAETQLKKDIEEAVSMLKAEDAKIREEIKAGLAEIYRLAILNDDGVMGNVRAFEEKVSNIVAELRGQINDLLARVQSLVYVPDYSDHKATIEWATISPIASEDANFAAPTIIAKASDFKYLVKAEKAAEVAAAIARNWNEVLDYNVTDVKTRGGSASGADLEIINVKAEDEYIIVSAVAKNFDVKFFENERQGIYSAALVLADDNDTRTTEYTNLVPAKTPEQFQMALFLPVEDPEFVGESDMRMVAAGEVITYKMPCNDTKTVKSAVKPIAGFVPVVNGQPNITNPVSFFTPELMVEEGYDVEVAKNAVIVCYDGTHNREFYANPEKLEGIETGKYFNIGEGPKWDYHYTVKEGTTFDSVGENSTVTYEYTCGNTTVTLTYDFVLANAQVDITITKTIPWSIAFAQKFIDAKKLYQFNAEADADENGITVTGADGYRDLESVLSQKTAAKKNYKKGENGWVETANQSIAFQRYDGGDAVFGLVNYSFNNSYKTVYTTTNDDLHVDYNTSIIVNLVGYEKEITVPVEGLKFNLDGTLGEFVAPADLKGEAYKKLTENYDFLGYGDKNSENWDAMFASYVEPYGKGELGVPYVNDTKSNWVRNLNGLTEARLFWNEKAHQVIDGVNTITWSVNPVNDFTINYVVSGTVNKPAGELLYADSYVVNGVATAKGQLEKNEQGVMEYSIIESHLPFYFNANDVDFEKHNYTVKFEVVENDKVTLSNDVVDVLAKNGSYYPLENDATLDWAEYSGLEVNVIATLYANGYQIDTKPLKIVTNDPLNFTIANVEVQREMREDITVQIFQNAVLTSAVEPEKENLISFLTTTGKLKSVPFAFKYAMETYGLDIRFVPQDPTAESLVYYYDNAGTGKKIYLPDTQYTYELDEEGNPKGHLTIKGDDAVAKNYYADFTAIMSSRICSGEHRVNFQVKIVGTK